MKKINAYNIFTAIVVSQMILILMSLIFPVLFLLDVILLIYYVILFILDKRPFIAYLAAKWSQSSFVLEKNCDTYIKSNIDFENDGLDYIWETLLNLIYCCPFERNSFQKKYNRLVNYYSKRYIANEIDIKRIINVICKYLKLDGNIQVKFVVESASPGNVAGWFERLGSRGCNIYIVIYDGMCIEQLIAICFHECLHFFYHSNGIKFDEDEEDYFVDAGLIYFGLDEIAILGYKKYAIKGKRYINNVKPIRCGYLSSSDLEYLMYKKGK